MSSTIAQIRRALDVEPTPKDKGLVATFKVVIYDTNLVTVNGVPMGRKEPLPEVEPAHALLAAMESIAAQLTEFYAIAQQRRVDLAADRPV